VASYTHGHKYSSSKNKGGKYRNLLSDSKLLQREPVSVSSTQVEAGATRSRTFLLRNFFLSLQRSEYVYADDQHRTNVSFRDQTRTEFDMCLVRITRDKQAIRAKIFCVIFFSSSEKIPGYCPAGEDRLLPDQLQFIIFRYSSYHSTLYHSAS
jgi:hypothetical protein